MIVIDSIVETVQKMGAKYTTWDTVSKLWQPHAYCTMMDDKES